ncbi:MAG TPA: methylated-DNA--[protein]-cysteine S-methyltransferase [Gemmatimonadaceae bacterium]|nr:methylated-DNA--[protein]-cysteine S-methyltransferase [Gemmatimonadaceae bacterium]
MTVGEMTAISYTTIDSPVGRLMVAADDDAVRLIEFQLPGRSSAVDFRSEPRETALLRETRDQLGEYFAGCRRRFDLPLDPRGSPFQQRVWSALLEVPYGATCSYMSIARRLGDPRATRAVGAANGRNPIPIIIPCHRVIGADGTLTGYGGGLERKRYLLRLEGALYEGELFAEE